MVGVTYRQMYLHTGVTFNGGGGIIKIITAFWICFILTGFCNILRLDSSSCFLDRRKTHARTRYSKTCVKRPLSKSPKNGFQDRLSLYAGHKYSRMLQREHIAISSTFIKLPFVIKIVVLSIFEWPFYTDFTLNSSWC